MILADSIFNGTAAVLGGLLTAFVTAMILLYRARADRESVVVDAAKGVAEASAMLVEPLRKELVAAREEITLSRERIVVLEKEVHSLTEEVAQLSAALGDAP